MKSRLDTHQEVAALVPDGHDFLARIAGPFRRSWRLHPLRGKAAACWAETDRIPWSDNGYYYAADQDPGACLDYHTGVIWPQDAASQLPVTLLNPQPGEVVVDCCAAPGSKSTQIGLALADQGLLICCDNSPPRRKVLRENLARQGIACGLVTPMPVAQLAGRHPGCADAVLVDAPCSGHVACSVKQSARQARRQLSLLHQAALLLRPGGRLVYSTCTPSVHENEGVLESFLQANPAWSMATASVAGAEADLRGLGAWRCWPQRQGCEAFFACALQAPGDGPRGTSLVGRLPAACTAPDAALQGLHVWESGRSLLVGSPLVAQCALPSEARGLLLGYRQEDRCQYLPWAAQACIERGAEAHELSHAEACRLWAGDDLKAALPPHAFVKTGHGAPLGRMDAKGRQLDIPSRLRRPDLL